MHHKRLLQKHMAEVHQDKDGMESYKNTTCMLCGKILTNFKTLARHLINKHQDKDPKNIRLVKKETCRRCGLVLQRVTDRIRHEIRRHGMQNKTRLKVSFQCTHCEKKFSRDLNLKFHEVHCHGIVPDRSIFFYCKVEGCNYVGRDKYNLEWHIQRRHNKGCVYSCELCGKQYKAAPDVDNHIKRVHTCRVCEKKIGTQQELKLHLNSDHSLEELKPLQCDICLQRFAQKQGLGMHLYRHHDRPLPKGTMWYHCDKCSYVSAFINHLGKHRQLHEGTTVFTCEICQQAFFNQTGLTNHGLRMHKGVQWAKPGEAAKSNLCHICSRNFKFEKLLQLHLYKHHGQQLSDGYTWHRCEKCSFVTDIRVNLKAHTKNVHSGSVVHTCSVCKTAFISNAALKCHQLIHKGAICPQRDCPVICESEVELGTHMQQEHEGEKATHHKKKKRGRPKKKAPQKRSEESAESGSETDASVEFHDTDDDDNGTERSNKLSLEFDTDITELNETPAFTYELRQRKPRKYQQELECEFDEDTDDIEGN